MALESEWSSLERVKLFVSIITPLTVVIVGYFITKQLDKDREERGKQFEEKRRQEELEREKQQKIEDQRELGRQRIEAKRELYRKFLSDYVKTYNSAKRIRRLLRVICSLENEGMVSVEPYHEQMQALIDVQLQFEYLKKVVENSDVFLEARDLALYLYSIESYLNKIVGEYEDKYKSFARKDLYPINELPYLRDFIISTKYSKKFKPMFKDAGDKGLAAMLKLLTVDYVEIEESHDVDALIKDLENKDSMVRLRAVKELGKSKDLKDMEPLINALGDKSGYVRLRTIKALGKLHDAKKIDKIDEDRIREQLNELISSVNEYDIVREEAEDLKKRYQTEE